MPFEEEEVYEDPYVENDEDEDENVEVDAEEPAEEDDDNEFADEYRPVPEPRVQRPIRFAVQGFIERERARREHARATTLQQLRLGQYFPYNANVLEYLGVDPKGIPAQAFGIEIELHTSQTAFDYTVAYAAWRAERDRLVAEHLKKINCKAYKHWGVNEATTEHIVRRVDFVTCPICNDLRAFVTYADQKKLSAEASALDAIAFPEEPEYPVSAENSRALFISKLTEDMPEGSFLAKRDGSLDETYGVEIVSVPLGLKDARAWLLSLGRFGIGQGACVPTANYGMHVHVNRKAFRGRAHILRFYHAMNAKGREALLIAFIGGDRHYANQHGDPTRRNEPWAKLRHEGFHRFLYGKMRDEEHHDAVSLKPEETIEVRIFQSSTDYMVTSANLDLVAALIEYTIPSAGLGPITKFSFSSFFAWALEERYKDYPFLYERLLKLIADGTLVDPRLTPSQQRKERKKRKAADKEFVCAS